ncbi:MAG: tetratricopeptide repeat protein, partial [Planctomycetaceae bacterium]
MSELNPACAGFELVHQPQWDVAVAPAASLADPLEPYRKQLVAIEKLPAERRDEPQVREVRATAHYQLGHLAPALADLDFLIGKDISTASILQYRTLTLARLGQSEPAAEALKQFLATDADESIKAYVRIQVSAWLDDFEQALENLQQASEQHTDNLYNIACAAALSSQAFDGKDAAHSQAFADRALELLQQLVTAGDSNVGQLKSDPDFASLHADPRFHALLADLEPPARYAGLWQTDVNFESKLLASVPMDTMQEQLKPLLAQGYRPFAIAVSSGKVLSSESGGTDQGNTGLATASIVLHRPLIPDVDKEQLALQKAAAATALLRLNAAERVWPLFQHQADPRLCSYLLHRLASFDVDPDSLLTQLNSESEVSRRRALILGIGEFAKAGLLSEEQQVTASEIFLGWYGDDPDSGIHGAAEWSLRQLGKESEIADVRAAYALGMTVDDRQWYLTKEGQHTMMVIHPQEEFL